MIFSSTAASRYLNSVLLILTPLTLLVDCNTLAQSPYLLYGDIKKAVQSIRRISRNVCPDARGVIGISGGHHIMAPSGHSTRINQNAYDVPFRWTVF